MATSRRAKTSSLTGPNYKVPDMLSALADVNMHAIQTSGNCSKCNSRPFRRRHREVEDPRITAELIRQWSTDHPEFAYLPLQSRISDTDRALIRFHDIGLQFQRKQRNRL